MQKKIFILILVIFIYGCGGDTVKDETPISDVEFRKGTEGIVIEFLNKAPPDTVFENTPFQIIMRLDNLGAEDVEQGFITLGLERDYLDLIKWDFKEGFLENTDSKETSLFSLEGKTITNPTGGREFVSINVKSKSIEAQSESHASLVFATACYQYRTELGTSVCIDTDIFNLRPIEKVCQVKEMTFTAGQGAPVAITKVETQILPDDTSDKIRPQFLIHIENKGNGEVIHKERHKQVCTTLNRGDNEELFEEFNIVFVKAFLSDEIPLDCNPTDEEIESEISSDIGKVKLKDKKAIARCILSKEGAIEGTKDAYISPLRIELDYGYTETISAQTTIEKVLKY